MENDEIIIGCDGMGNLRTWVDLSYAIHQDMRGQTGGTILMGHGLVNHK